MFKKKKLQKIAIQIKFDNWLLGRFLEGYLGGYNISFHLIHGLSNIHICKLGIISDRMVNSI